jgi:hypothetical protein
MREGLAREFPEALRAAAWTRARVRRRLVFAGEPVMWATISGIGAGFLAAAVMQALVGLTNEAIQSLRAPMPFPLFPAVTIAGTAAAVAVALAIGGPIALALNLAYVALGVALRIPGTITFCQRSADQLGFPDLDRCTAIGFLASLWPQFVGIGLGLVLARVMTSRGNGINSLLRVAGAFAVALFVVSSIWGMTATAQATDLTASALTISAAIVAAAAAAGIVAAQLPRGLRSATIVAAVWLVPWAALQLPSASRALTGPIAPDNAVPIVARIFFLIEPIAAAFLVLGAAIGARSRFIPREPA